jgi:hypothetical protein
MKNVQKSSCLVHVRNSFWGLYRRCRCQNLGAGICADGLLDGYSTGTPFNQECIIRCLGNDVKRATRKRGMWYFVAESPVWTADLLQESDPSVVAFRSLRSVMPRSSHTTWPLTVECFADVLATFHCLFGSGTQKNNRTCQNAVGSPASHQQPVAVRGRVYNHSEPCIIAVKSHN